MISKSEDPKLTPAGTIIHVTASAHMVGVVHGYIAPQTLGERGLVNRYEFVEIWPAKAQLVLGLVLGDTWREQLHYEYYDPATLAAVMREKDPILNPRKSVISMGGILGNPQYVNTDGERLTITPELLEELLDAREQFKQLNTLLNFEETETDD
jgi:hypothetical protein